VSASDEPLVVVMEVVPTVSTIPQVQVKATIPTLNRAIQEYVAELKSMGYSDTVISGAETTLEMFELWLGKKSVSRETVIGFRHHLDNHPTWSGRTAGWRWGCAVKFLDWLVIGGYTQVKIASGIRAPSAKPAKYKKLPITEHTYRKIMDAETSPVSRWLYCLMWNTGMAVGDAASLQWDEVDMDTATITRVRMKTNATDRPCIIPVQRPGELWDMLVERDGFRESEEDRYPNINGKCYVHPKAWLDWESQRVHNRWVHKTTKAAGIVGAGLSLHSFRKGFVSRMAKGGINPFVGCQITGHKDPKMFQHYVQTDPEFIRYEVERALSEAAQRK